MKDMKDMKDNNMNNEIIDIKIIEAKNTALLSTDIKEHLKLGFVMDGDVMTYIKSVDNTSSFSGHTIDFSANNIIFYQKMVKYSTQKTTKSIAS